MSNPMLPIKHCPNCGCEIDDSQTYCGDECYEQHDSREQLARAQQEMERLKRELNHEAVVSDKRKEERDKAESRNRELRDALRGLLAKSECIRHWHDTMPNKETGECEGMVVSASHVRDLWEANHAARTLLAQENSHD